MIRWVKAEKLYKNLTKRQKAFISGKIWSLRQAGADRHDVLVLISVLNINYLSYVEEIWPEETNEIDR